jgi:DNA (cytosine-5)-methyltransferase 1
MHRGKSSSERPLLLDLFCCAGGAAKGYHDAGFEVVGVDIEPQPNYPFEFIQADALRYLEDLIGFRSPVTAIHASPPCQGYLNLGGVNKAQGRDYDHPDLIAATRALIVQTGLPYVIENVADAKPLLKDPVRLCGSSFGLPIRRHRLFESNVSLVVPPCNHRWQKAKRYWTGWRPKGETVLATVVQIYGNAGGRDEWPKAMGIDWMSSAEMIEAIPPAYTEFLGRQLIRFVELAQAQDEEMAA